MVIALFLQLIRFVYFGDYIFFKVFNWAFPELDRISHSAMVSDEDTELR